MLTLDVALSILCAWWTVYYCLVLVDLWHPGWVRESDWSAGHQ